MSNNRESKEEEPALRLGMEHTVRVSLKAEPSRPPLREKATGFRKRSSQEIPKSKPELQSDVDLPRPEAKSVPAPVSFGMEMPVKPKAPQKESPETEEKPLRLGTEHTIKVSLKVEPQQKTHEFLTEKDHESVAKARDLETEWASGEDDSVSDHKIPMGWFVLIGVVLLAVVASGVILFQGTKEPALEVGVPMAAFEIEDKAVILPEVDPEKIKDYERYYLSLEDTVRRYFAAESPEDLVGLIRHEERVMPYVRESVANAPLVPREYRSISSMSTVPIDVRPFLALSISFADGTSDSLLVEDLPSGFRVDWETENIHQSMDPSKFVAMKSQEVRDFRVRVIPVSYYSYMFQNEKEWIALRLDFDNSDEILYGYIKRGTRLAEEFRKIFQTNGLRIKRPMILSVKYPPDSRAPRSVLIEKIASPIWAYGEDPSKAQPREED